MANNHITVSEALKRLGQGKSIEGATIHFEQQTVKALDAFRLGKAGIEVPEEAIAYHDTDVAFDPEFDEDEWVRTELDPTTASTEKLTVSIDIHPAVKAWIQQNEISLDHLMAELIHGFYTANQLIEGKS